MRTVRRACAHRDGLGAVDGELIRVAVPDERDHGAEGAEGLRLGPDQQPPVVHHDVAAVEVQVPPVPRKLEVALRRRGDQGNAERFISTAKGLKRASAKIRSTASNFEPGW